MNPATLDRPDLSALANAGMATERYGHPRGLIPLALTELFDRISFHSLQALLVLYMVDYLLTEGPISEIWGFGGFRAGLEAVTGPLSQRALASQIFGLYIALVQFTPILGGFLGDRVLGRTLTIALGATLMALGHIAMSSNALFLVALTLLFIGCGLLRGNLATQLGELYAPGDGRRAAGFQLYYAMVNTGAFLAPLVGGLTTAIWGWHVGFATAAVGMLIGLLIYLYGQKDLPATKTPAADPGARATIGADGWRRVIYLMPLVPLLSTFWIAQSQVWNTYNLWARDHLDLTLLGFAIPVPWLQSLDGVAPLIMLPAMLRLWAAQRAAGRDSDEFTRLAIGCALFGGGTLWLGAGTWVFGDDRPVPLLWAVVFHFWSNLGWLYVTPVAVSLYSRAAPPQLVGTLIGMNALSISIGSIASGRIGALYEQITPANFWFLHGAIVILGGIALALYGRIARPVLFADHETERATP